MTREEILKASTAQINEWIDETIMKDRKHYAGDWPKWSSDIAAAWEVVERMRPTHIYELADFGRNTHKTKQHYAWFHSIDRSSRAPNEYQFRASTLPEAICKAALLAILEATP